MVRSTNFPAQLDHLRSMLKWVHQHLGPMEFDPATLRKIELAMEEALVNIIQHAYQNQMGKIEIEVRAFPKSHAEIILKDNGPPFNPLQQKQPNIEAALEDREIGGLGIYLMRQYTDELRYEREPDANVLTLVIRSFQKK